MKKTLIFGTNGQVARALIKRLPDAIAVGLPEIDFLKPETILAALDKHQPEIIINAVAYTAVDKAESEELPALQINALTPGLIGDWAAKHKALLIHYSTDYVFDGSGTKPWKEMDNTGPLSAYGRSKLLGEKEITRSGCHHFIFRLCWVYDETGKNFVNTMLRLGKERESLNVVADQFGAPTYAGDIAEATMKAIAQPKAKSGIYHFCNSSETSWAGFAEAIFKQANLPTKVNHITTAEYPTPAKRPANSRLDTTKFRASFGWDTIPSWQDGLKRCMI
jgi:dTDP-4-dehydrorhamnose reductase